MVYSFLVFLSIFFAAVTPLTRQVANSKFKCCNDRKIQTTSKMFHRHQFLHFITCIDFATVAEYSESLQTFFIIATAGKISLAGPCLAPIVKRKFPRRCSPFLFYDLWNTMSDQGNHFYSTLFRG